MNEYLYEGRQRTDPPRVKQLRTKLPAAAFALLVLLGAAWSVDFYGGRLVQQIQTLSRTTAENSASTVVRSYLETLAAGDADAVLALSLAQPTDRALLTDQDLAWSQSRFPINEIRVGKAHVNGHSAVVKATYNLGGLKISRPFFTKLTAGHWKMESGFATVDLTPLTLNGLPLQINGTPRAKTASVFPGAHRLSTGLDLVEFSRDVVWLVESPDETWLPQPRPAPELTKAGLSNFLRASEHAVQDCAEQRSLAPPGCPFSAPLQAGQKIDPATARWEVSRLWLSGVAPSVQQGLGSSWVQAGFVLEVTLFSEGTERGHPSRFVQDVRTYVTVTAPLNPSSRHRRNAPLTVSMR